MRKNDTSSVSSRYGDQEEDKIIKQLNQVRSMKNSKRRGVKVPREIASLMAQAKNQYIFGFPEKAQKILEDIICNYPDYEEAYQIYGRICQDHHDSARAANFLMLAAKSKSSSHHKNYSNIGYLLKDKSNYQYEMAASYFGKALKSDSNNIQLMEERSICFREIGDYRKAIKELEKLRVIADCVQIKDKSTESTKQIAQVQNIKIVYQLHFKIQQYERAKEELTKIVSINDMQTIVLMIQILIEQSKQIDLIPFIEQVYEIKQKDNQKVFDTIIQLEHFDVMSHWLLALKSESQSEFNNFALKYLTKIFHDGNVVQFNEFLTCIDKFNVNLDIQLLEELKEMTKNNKIFHQIEQSLRRRYFTLIGNVGDKQDLVNPKYQKINISSFQQGFDDFIDQQRLQSDSKSASESLNQKENFYLDHKKIKKEEDQASQVFFSDDEIKQEQGQLNHPQERIIPFSEQVLGTLQELQKIQTKEEVNYLYSQLTQMLQKSPDQLDKIFSVILKLIQFEKQYYDIKKQLMDRFSKESQKCNFKKLIKSQNYLQQLDHDQKPIVFKTQKLQKQQEFLKKRKNKIAELKTDDQLKGIYCLSILQTGDVFLALVFEVAKLLFEADKSYQLYLIIYELKTNLHLMIKKWMKITMQKSEELYTTMRFQYAVYGLWSTLKEHQYIHSFPFIKQLVKLNPSDHLQTALLSLVLRKLNNPQIYKTWLAKITPEIAKNKNMIITIANQHYNNACFKQAVELYDHLIQSSPQNPLLNLLLSLSYLQMSTSRLAIDRQILVKKALYFFNQYREARCKDEFYLETLYNMGRFYLHLNILSKAMEIFEEVLQNCTKQKIEINGQKDVDQTNMQALQFKSAFNLVQLHKQLGNNQKAIEYLDQHLTF